MTQEEIETRLTLTTTGDEEACSRGLAILYLWGDYGCPHPGSSKWEEFVSEVKVSIHGQRREERAINGTE